MLALISIPHTKKPFVDFYDSPDDLIEAALTMAACDSDQDEEEITDVLEAVYYLCHDMSGHTLIDCVDDIKALSATKNQGNYHQKHLILGKILPEIINYYQYELAMYAVGGGL